MILGMISSVVPILGTTLLRKKRILRNLASLVLEELEM